MHPLTHLPFYPFTYLPFYLSTHLLIYQKSEIFALAPKRAVCTVVIKHNRKL